MKFEIRSTKDYAEKGINILVYSQPGMGKTTMAATTGGTPLILSVESGLLSIADHGLDYITITSFDDLIQIFEALQVRDAEFEKYDWVILDSVTEIGEVCLREEQVNHKHGLEAYQALATRMFGLLRAFRDLDRHIYMSAKEEVREVDEMTKHFPMMPGNKLRQGVAYDFDFVAHMRNVRDSKTKKLERMLVFEKDIRHPQLKERSAGKLDPFEPPNLANLLAKLQPTKKGKKK